MSLPSTSIRRQPTRPAFRQLGAVATVSTAVDGAQGPCDDCRSPVPFLPAPGRFMRRPGRPFVALALLGLAGLLPSIAAAAGVPAHNRIVVVIMENKPYDTARLLPYTASLIASSASFSRSFAVTHPSQPNYVALWAGATLGVTNDNCPPAGSPFAAENLGHACEAAGLTWRAYSENLAVVGSPACSYDGNSSTGLYTRKHDPWTDFNNV